MQRFRDQALEDFGKFARVAFFVATAAAWVTFVRSLNSSVGDTPFAQLTLNALLGSVFQRILWLGVVWVWLTWAFTSSKKHYRAWGWLGLGVVSVALIAALVKSQISN
jgi:hypothetical protein